MIAKFLISFLIISINIAQICWAKPKPEEDLCLLQTKYDFVQPSEKDDLLSPSIQLLKYTTNGLKALTLQYASGAKSISQQLLQDKEVTASKSLKIMEFKQNLTKFQEKYAACDGLDELFDLAEAYSNTTSFYFDLVEADLDDDSKLILQLLRKYNSENLDNEFEKYFNVFVEKFDKKFESLKESLTKEQNKLNKNLLEWFVRFKTLTIYDDKIQAFEKFLEFYD